MNSQFLVVQIVKFRKQKQMHNSENINDFKIIYISNYTERERERERKLYTLKTVNTT